MNEARSDVNENGVMINGINDAEDNENGPWVVVQKPRRPRKTKEGNSAGPSQAAGTGTRFDILETINADPEIGGDNNDEPINRGQTIDNFPISKHGKGRGKNTKQMGDKKGKAAENKEPPKQKPMSLNSNGTHVVTIMQKYQEKTNGELTRGEIQGNKEVRQEQLIANDQHSISQQVPHNIHEGTNGIGISHVGNNHAPRPPEKEQLGQVVNYTSNGPNIHEKGAPAQRTNEEDMEITIDTPNLNQEEEGAKNMVLT
jgi:hypothetical protein